MLLRIPKPLRMLRLRVSVRVCTIHVVVLTEAQAIFMPIPCQDLAYLQADSGPCPPLSGGGQGWIRNSDSDSCRLVALIGGGEFSPEGTIRINVVCKPGHELRRPLLLSAPSAAFSAAAGAIEEACTPCSVGTFNPVSPSAMSAGRCLLCAAGRRHTVCHAHTHAHTRAHIYTHTYTHTHTHTYTYTHTHTHTRLYKHTYEQAPSSPQAGQQRASHAPRANTATYPEPRTAHSAAKARTARVTAAAAAPSVRAGR